MSSDNFSALILSDAHLGWVDPTQPTLAAQLAALRVMHRRFSKPGLLIDTGDAHHGGLEIGAADRARADWTAIVSNEFPQLPLLYVPGNHEMLDFRGEDAEWRSCRLGSLGLRPYWSFDFRGIHFVSVPQMRRVNLVNREMLEWLEFDLDRHRHMTTILLAHQALLGTTFNNGELDYRALVNSDAIFALLNRHPQVKAWMHGHNHTFEVVTRDERLYVSNGRIGGFIPPLEWGDFGQPNLGGVLLEIDADAVRVSSIDASNGRRFEQAHMRGELRTATSLDSRAATQFSMGLGLAAGGDHRPLNRHFSSVAPLAVSARRARARSLNDDPGLRLSCPLWGDRGKKRIERGEQALFLIHSLILAPSHVWSTSAGGLTLKRKSDVDLQPVRLLLPGRIEQKIPYFSVTQAASYRLSLRIDAPGRLLIRLRLLLREEPEDEPFALELKPITLTGSLKRPLIDFEIEHPEARSSSLLLGLELRMDSEAALIQVRRMELYRLPALKPLALSLALPGLQPIALNPTGFATQVSEASGSLESGTLQLSGGDGWPMVVALTQKDCDFQIRQAEVRDHLDHLEIGPLTSPWSPDEQICMARLSAGDGPFICATRRVTRLLLFPLERDNALIRLTLLEFSDGAEIELCAPAPLRARGAKFVRSEGERHVYLALEASIEFS